MNTVHYKSNSNDWQTPKALFNYWNNIYHFDIDAAASKENALCERYYTQELDALKQDWSKDGKTIWLNSPYGRELPKFIKKAYEESLKGCVIVYLMPARPDTRAWHNYIMKAYQIYFIKGRLKFIDPNNPEKLSPAPFPSCIVIFDDTKAFIKSVKMQFQEAMVYSFDQNLLR